MPNKSGAPEDSISLDKLEDTLEALEGLVEQLESGELSLEKAVGEFERGMKLTRQCQAVLRQAEQKVEILLAEAAEPAPFEEQGED